MHIYATKKVMSACRKAERTMKEAITNVSFLDEGDSPDRNPFFEWHANIVKVNQDDCLIVTHDQTGLTLILLNIYEDDMIDLYDWIEEALADLLERLGFSQQSIRNYLTPAEGVALTISKAWDAKKIGRNSSVVSILRQLAYYLEEDFTVQGYWQYLTSRLNRSLKQEAKPFDLFISEYENVIGPVSYKSEMAEFEIRLNMHSLPDIVRIVQMPMSLTFEDFHHVIQTVFMWQNSHLHQFILDDGATVIGTEQKVNMGRYQMGNDEEAYAASRLQLADVITLEENGVMTYIYDYGDSWEHTIRARRFYSEKKRPFPKLTMMSGDPVPENIGGPSGYEYFLDVINDPTHDEHSVIKEWAKDYITRLMLYNDVNHFNHALKARHS